MAVDIKDVEQVAQELQQKFDDFKAKNDKRGAPILLIISLTP